MNKLEMAHQMACAMMASNDGYTIDGAIECAWEYADAMQKEADERDNKEACGHDWNEITSNGDKYRFFVCKNCDATRNFEPIEEWQPDWSQAPEWANWWAMDGFGDKKAHWYRDKPYLDDDSEVESEWNADLYSNKDAFVWSPSFNYQGDWKDSLRKRP